MITLYELIPIGRTTKTRGTKGEIELRLTESIAADDLAACFESAGETGAPAVVCLFVEIDGLPVPFFFKNCRQKDGETLVVQVDGFPQERAAELVGRNVFVHKSIAQELGLDSALERPQLAGLTVATAEGTLGTVTSVDDTTANTLLTVATPEGRNLLIPFHPDMVEAFDEQAGRLQLALPEGLLHLND